jgi:predicted ABC-type ATPase
MPTCSTSTEPMARLFAALSTNPELVGGLIYLTLSKLSRNEDVLIINRAFQIHNPQFNYPEFGLIELESGVNRIFMSVGQFNSKIGYKKRMNLFCNLASVNNKKLYIIAGCNGAGKTTASFTILPDILDCKEFVNADEIAKGLSPFQPEKVSIEAGRIMLKRINELLSENENFAFETTLSSKSYKNKIVEAKKKGYRVTLLFFWLQNTELAKERVKTRVFEGGHNIKPDVIERRYIRGIKNLFDVYLPIVDGALIFDNSEGKHELLADKQIDGILNIVNQKKFNLLKRYYEND